MAPGDALLRAILADPADDTPRLVYADWLEENGDPARAEFIRLQIELAGALADDSRRDALQDRARQLQAEHEKAWLAPVRRWLHRWEFRRGFAEWVAIDADRFARRAGALFGHSPVRGAGFYRVSGRVGELAAVPEWARLTHIGLHGGAFGDSYGILFGDEEVRALAAAPLKGVTSLWFDGTLVSDEAFQALAASPRLTGLRRLQIQISVDVGVWSGSRSNARAADLGPKLATWFGPGVCEVYEEENLC